MAASDGRRPKRRPRAVNETAVENKQFLPSIATTGNRESMMDRCRPTRAAASTADFSESSAPPAFLQPSSRKTRHRRRIVLPSLLLMMIFMFPCVLPTVCAAAAAAGAKFPPISSHHRQLFDLDNLFYSRCKIAMYVSDENKDFLLSRQDYTSLLGRLVTRLDVTTFENLDVVFREAFQTVRSSDDDGDEEEGGIDVAGTQVGTTPTPAEDEHLRSVCTAIGEAMEQYESEQQQQQAQEGAEEEESGGSEAPALNDNNNNNGEDNGDESNVALSDPEYRACKMAMYVADNSQPRDSMLTPTEYVQFVSRLTQGAVRADGSFEELDAVFRASHEALVDAETGLMDVTGSRPGTTPTEEQDAALRSICRTVDAAIAQYNAASAMDDPMGSDEDETIAPTVAPTLADSFGADTPSGTAPPEEPPADDMEQNPDEYAHLLDVQQCQTAMLTADTNYEDQVDRSLDPNEYAAWISILEPSVGGDSLDDLAPALVNLFHDLAADDNHDGSEMKISVRGISPIDNEATQEDMDHLETVCTELFAVIERLMNPQAFLDECRLSLDEADTDRDGHLSKVEFAPYAYALTFPFLLAEQLRNIQFASLPSAVRLSFDVLSDYEEDFDISTAALESVVSDGPSTRLQQICDLIHDKVMVDLLHSTNKAQNSFIISNLHEIEANDLRSGSERQLLEQAYAAFAMEQASNVVGRRRKQQRRGLTIVGAVPSSSRIDQIENTPCPIEAAKAAVCQTVSASFDIILLNETNSQANLDQLENLSQEAIASGSLQEQISALGSELTVEGTPQSLAAEDSGTAAPSSESNDMEFDPFSSLTIDPGAMIVLICTTTLAFLMLVFGCICSRRVRLKQKGGVLKSQEWVVRSKEWERTGELNGDYEDEDDVGLSTLERAIRAEARELRKSPAPLLLTHACHLPGFSYGEDLYQYIYYFHPLFGFCFRHPQHPVGFRMRLVSLLASCSFGVCATNIVFLAFHQTGQTFDQEALETEFMGRSLSVSNGNVVLWTVGAGLHALYDLHLWSITTWSFCLNGGLPAKVRRKRALGSILVILSMSALALIAMITTWMRVNVLDDKENDSVTPMAFGEAFGTEICTAFFFFWPVIGFIFFSGLLGCCCCKEWWGGRPYEVRMENRDLKRKERLKERSKALDVSESGFECGTDESASRQSTVINQNANVSIRSLVQTTKPSHPVKPKMSHANETDQPSPPTHDKEPAAPVASLSADKIQLATSLEQRAPPSSTGGNTAPHTAGRGPAQSPTNAERGSHLQPHLSQKPPAQPSNVQTSDGQNNSARGSTQSASRMNTPHTAGRGSAQHPTNAGRGSNLQPHLSQRPPPPPASYQTSNSNGARGSTPSSNRMNTPQTAGRGPAQHPTNAGRGSHLSQRPPQTAGRGPAQHPTNAARPHLQPRSHPIAPQPRVEPQQRRTPPPANLMRNGSGHRDDTAPAQPRDRSFNESRLTSSHHREGRSPSPPRRHHVNDSRSPSPPPSRPHLSRPDKTVRPASPNHPDSRSPISPRPRHGQTSDNNRSTSPYHSPPRARRRSIMISPPSSPCLSPPPPRHRSVKYSPPTSPYSPGSFSSSRERTSPGFFAEEDESFLEVSYSSSSQSMYSVRTESYDEHSLI